MSGSVVQAASAPRRRTKVAGFGLNVASIRQAVDLAIDHAAEGKGFTFHTLNLDHVAKLRSSAAFRNAYRRATFVCADGWPIVWLANRAAGRRLFERAAGADLIEPLLQAAAQHGLPVYLIGPGPRAQTEAIAELKRSAPGLLIAGAETPRIGLGDVEFDRLAMAERIRASGARLCLAALGAPKQELLTDALAPHCPSVGFICVGAALDFIAGHARRAPLWMRRCGLEWLWRLGAEPYRLAARYAACAYVFLLLGIGVDVVPTEELR
jgi:N-acetylglucosaminyldiphosphoundecaprenol N-acetyl-beta-D-mannosaminyltransferase